jgi:glycosyltransferase involved in cell wall biosynthesis
VLFVGRSYFRGGGSATRLMSMIESLSRKHRVFVLTIVPLNERQSTQKNKNVWVLSCPIKPRLTIIPFLSLANVFLVFFYVRRLLQEANIDIVIASVPEFEEGIGTAIASKGKVSRMVIDVGDLIVDDHVAAVYNIFPKFFRRVISFILRTSFIRTINSFDSAVTVTHTLRQAMMKEGIFIPIHVIENGADTSLFHPVDNQTKHKIRKELGLDGDPLMLYAGAMGVDYYPMEVIFKAMKIVIKSFPNARLILCGSWNQQVERQASRLGAQAKYLGFLKLSDMARVMQTCDVGLITMDDRPSTFVALTTKFFEYLASGVPVVVAVPKGGELDTLIGAEQVGFSVVSGDYETMGKRLIELLDNANKRRVFAQNGVKLVAARFDRAKLAENFHNVLLQNSI